MVTGHGTGDRGRLVWGLAPSRLNGYRFSIISINDNPEVAMQPDLDTAPDRGTDPKLTQPLGGVVRLIMILATLLVAFVLFVAIFGKIELGGLGSGPACSPVHLGGIAIAGPAVARLRPGATASAGMVTLCASHPTVGQRVLASLNWVPAVAVYLAVIALLGQLLRCVRTAGPFAVTVARRLRFLGWLVLAGSVIVAAGQSAAQSAFASTVITGPGPAVHDAVEAGLTVILLPLLVACGLLTLARVIRAGAQMSDDLAGTV
jgi:hypothetical protein